MQLVRAWLLVWVSMAFTSGVQAEQALPQSQVVLVSSHPVAMLLKSAWPQLNIQTLMPANQSPHDFALRPSHRKIIEQSDYLIWLGLEMEPYLSKLVVNHHGALDLSHLFSEIEEQAHDINQEDDQEGHHHGGHDPHIWLNPGAIELILQQVQQHLNLPWPSKFLVAFNAWLPKATKQMAELGGGFVSFHDAFHYWVEYFELNQVAVLAINPEQPIGTRHLVKVRTLLDSGNVSCLFVEPQFKASIVSKLQQGTQVPVVRIDPIGSQYNVNDGKFLDFYQYLILQFKTCLMAK